MKFLLLFSFVITCFSTRSQTVTMTFYKGVAMVGGPYGSNTAYTGCGKNSICALGPTFYVSEWGWGPLPNAGHSGLPC